MVVYIFVHPTINIEGIKWHLQQLSESHANIEKVVFIESYRADVIENLGTIEDNLNDIGKTSIEQFIREQYYPPTPENPEQYLPNLNLELDLDGYTNYFSNVSIYKGNLPTRIELGGQYFQIESYFLSGDSYRVTGIGCKRFLSQLLHLKFNPNMLYCAIDGFTLIYEVQYEGYRGKILSPYEVGKNSKGRDSIKKTRTKTTKKI